MNARSLLTGLSTILLTTGVAAADWQAIKGVPLPDDHAPLASWTAAQQYGTEDVTRHYGFPSYDGMLVLADELGDRQSHLQRASIIGECFRDRDASEQLANWALCRTDFKALDLAKAEAELVAAGVAADERESTMRRIKESYEVAKKVVDKLDAEAPRDKGLKKMLDDVEAAKKEWADYLAGHKAEVELYFKLRDAVRTGKRNDPAFDGCDKLTRPKFEKLVRSVAKTIPWDTDTLAGYMYYMVQTTDSYITTNNWAACGYSIHPSMDANFVQAAFQQTFVVRHGWRSMALGKLGAEGYKPRFADSAYYVRDVGTHVITVLGVQGSPNMGSPSYGNVKKMTVKDDEVTLSFNMGEIDGVCLRWETRYGEKQCAERGTVDNEVGDETVPVAYNAAIKKGVDVMTQAGFPVCVYNKPKKKMLAIFGVALK